MERLGSKYLIVIYLPRTHTVITYDYYPKPNYPFIGYMDPLGKAHEQMTCHLGLVYYSGLGFTYWV